MFEAIPRRKIFEDVARQIRAAIESGAYRAGDALPSERQLMAAFNVGRPAVRDALLVLEANGLVTIQHGRRARVAEPARTPLAQRLEQFVGRATSRADRLIDDIQETRLALEVAMARRAAECATPASIETLMAALDANRRAIHDRHAYLATDIAFHRTIASITQNVIFEEAAAAILEWLATFRHDLVHVEGANLLSHDEHVSIARAIAARDPDAAAEAMTRHQQRTHGLYRILTPARSDAAPAATAESSAPESSRRTGA